MQPEVLLYYDGIPTPRPAVCQALEATGMPAWARDAFLSTAEFAGGFNTELHPHGAPGSGHGGQFVTSGQGGGGSAPAATPAPAAAKAAPGDAGKGGSSPSKSLMEQGLAQMAPGGAAKAGQGVGGLAKDAAVGLGHAGLAVGGAVGKAVGALASIPIGQAREVAIAAQEKVHSIGVSMAKTYNAFGDFAARLNPVATGVSSVVSALKHWSTSKWDNLEKVMVEKHGEIKGRLILGTAGLLTGAATLGLGGAALAGALGVGHAMAAAGLVGVAGAHGGAVGKAGLAAAKLGGKVGMKVAGKVGNLAMTVGRGAASMVGYLGAKMLGFGKDVINEHLIAHGERKATAGKTVGLSLFAGDDEAQIDFAGEIMPAARKLAQQLAASLHQAIHGEGTEDFWAKAGQSVRGAHDKKQAARDAAKKDAKKSKTAPVQKKKAS